MNHSIDIEAAGRIDNDEPIYTAQPFPGVNFDPSTPLPTNVTAHQSQPQKISNSICEHPSTRDGTSESAPLDSTAMTDNIFAWQESLRHASPDSASRPSSTSGWSMPCTDASEEGFIMVKSDDNASSKTSALRNGKSKSHARKRPPGHVSRPRNAFILFRSHAINNNLIPPSLGVKDNRAVSCIVASLWKSLPEAEREEWRFEAEKEKQLHRTQYPDYRFKPELNSSPSKPRQHAKTKEGVKVQCEQIADQILRAHGRTMVKGPGSGKGKRASTRETSDSLKLEEIDLPKTKKVASAIKKNKASAAPVAKKTVVKMRRSSSLPLAGEHFDDVKPIVGDRVVDRTDESLWQASQAAQTQPSLEQTERFYMPVNSFSSTREGTKPAPLIFNLKDISPDEPTFSTSFSSAPSPRCELWSTLQGRSYPSSIAPSPRRALFRGNSDAMLLSPVYTDFSNKQRDGSGWKSWSRFSLSLKQRRSIDSEIHGTPTVTLSSRRESFGIPKTPTGSKKRISQYPSEDVDDFLPQTPGYFHSSLHHTIVSPSLQMHHGQSYDLERFPPAFNEDIFRANPYLSHDGAREERRQSLSLHHPRHLAAEGRSETGLHRFGSPSIKIGKGAAVSLLGDSDDEEMPVDSARLDGSPMGEDIPWQSDGENRTGDSEINLDHLALYESV